MANDNIIDYMFNCVSINNPPVKWTPKKTEAYFIESSLLAKGLILVLSTLLSISLSHMSFIIQPADRSQTDPQ